MDKIVQLFFSLSNLIWGGTIFQPNSISSFFSWNFCIVLKWPKCSEIWNKPIKHFSQLWPPPLPPSPIWKIPYHTEFISEPKDHFKTITKTGNWPNFSKLNYFPFFFLRFPLELLEIAKKLFKIFFIFLGGSKIFVGQNFWGFKYFFLGGKLLRGKIILIVQNLRIKIFLPPL